MIKTWMIYGASGYSGRLITDKALEMGLTPVLAGRPSEYLRERAAKEGLQCREFRLDDPDIVHYLEDIDVVISTAGPFSTTAQAMIEACIKAKTHYFDITGGHCQFNSVQYNRAA
jgi:short subunit dehydrogenase-like uncharacterized protein